MNLPIEIKLDILQCLNYDQLFKLQKSNSHFYYLIDKYERNLARMKFKKMEITASFSYQNHGVIVFGIFDLPFVNLIKKAKFPSAEVKTKCQIAIDRRIPIYLCTNEPKEMFFISLFKKDSFQNHLVIKLPTFPKNIEEMLFVYYWLEQLFFTYFERINFNVLLNPELIKLFFENKTTKTSLQFCSLETLLRSSNYNCKSVLDFAQNYLFNEFVIRFNFLMVGNTEQYNDILLNLLLNGEVPLVCFQCIKRPTLHDMIINYIETSKNLSDNFPIIVFDHIYWSRLDLTISERAESIKRSRVVEREVNREVEYTAVTYNLTNKYNPRIKFYIWQKEKLGAVRRIDIKQISRYFMT